MARRIDDFRAGRGRNIPVNPRDGFIFAIDIGDVALAIGYDFAVFN
jgi:hypothetical protein